MSAANRDIASVLSLAVTTSSDAVSSVVHTNADGRGIVVLINPSVVSAGSFTVTISGVLNGIPYTLLTSAAVSSAANSILTVYPGATASSNVAASQPLPRQWQVTITPTGLTGIVNIGACIIV